MHRHPPSTARVQRATQTWLARWALAVAIAIACVLSAPRAGATQQTELAKGRQLYKAGSHLECEQFFATALDGTAPTIVDPELVAEGRMIRGTCDLYLGRQGDAIRQFELIARASPDFEPNPIDYPSGVLDEFHKTKKRVAAEATTKTKDGELEKELAKEREARAKIEAKYAKLATAYEEETVITRRSWVVAAIPFGVGQFQNGDDGLGIFFATAQGVALAGAVISWSIHQSLQPPPVDPSLQSRLTFDEATSRYANWISFGVFAALAIGGVVEAEIALVPESRQTRKRALPKDLAWSPFIAPTERGGVSIGIGGTF
jgi:hypothetical protein